MECRLGHLGMVSAQLNIRTMIHLSTSLDPPQLTLVAFFVLCLLVWRPPGVIDWSKKDKIIEPEVEKGVDKRLKAEQNSVDPCSHSLPRRNSASWRVFSLFHVDSAVIRSNPSNDRLIWTLF